MPPFQKFAQWENMKALLAGEVPYGVCCQEFKTFNPKDIRHYVVLYMFHGLSQPPQV